MHRARGRVCNRGEGYCIQRNFPKMNYTMAWIGCQATPIPLSLFRVNAFSNARIATVFVCITTALSRLVSRPLEYRGICKFWVELGQLTRARSNQRFWGRRERGKNGLAVFFFLHRYVLFIFFLRRTRPEARHLEFTTCRLHIIHGDIMRSRNLSGIQNSRGPFFVFSFLFFFATIYSFNVTRDGER